MLSVLIMTAALVGQAVTPINASVSISMSNGASHSVTLTGVETGAGVALVVVVDGAAETTKSKPADTGCVNGHHYRWYHIVLMIENVKVDLSFIVGLPPAPGGSVTLYEPTAGGNAIGRSRF
jgi:hypothetical protein